MARFEMNLMVIIGTDTRFWYRHRYPILVSHLYLILTSAPIPDSGIGTYTRFWHRRRYPILVSAPIPDSGFSSSLISVLKWQCTLAHCQFVTSSGASDAVCGQYVQHWVTSTRRQNPKRFLHRASSAHLVLRPVPLLLFPLQLSGFLAWFRVSAADCQSCLAAIRRKNKAFISGQHKYAYFCRQSQLLRIPAAKIARYGCERRDVECLQNALIPPPPTNTLVNLKSKSGGWLA